MTAGGINRNAPSFSSRCVRWGGNTDRSCPRSIPTRIQGLFRSVFLGVTILAGGAASLEADHSRFGFRKAAKNSAHRSSIYPKARRSALTQLLGQMSGRP